MEPPAKIWNAGLYARLSHEDGDKTEDKSESDSITNQKALIQDYAQGQADISIIKTYVDDGYSGASFDRPGFNAMMEDIKNGRINCVIVKDLSRFGRNFTEAGKYLEQIFPFLGVRFIAINDGLDSNNPQSSNDRILVPFKNLINDAYCKDISIKIRSQFEIKRKKGDFIGSFAAFGYLKDENNRNKLVVDDYAADIVRLIFKWKISGLNNQHIADKLNDTGVLSPLEYKYSMGQNISRNFQIREKATWLPQTIARILCDEVYIGVMTQGKYSTPNHKVKKSMKIPKDQWTRVHDTHEAIVEKEDFDTVQNLLLKDLRTAPRRETLYLFSGIATCADCGLNMIRKTVPYKGEKYFYYVCKASKTKECTTHNISEKLLEEAVLMAIQSHVGNMKNAERVGEFIRNLPIHQQDVKRAQQQLAKVESEIARYNNLKTSLYESMMEGIIDNEEYMELKATYTKKNEAAQLAASRLQEEISTILSENGKQNREVESFATHGNLITLTRVAILSLISEIVIYEGNRLEIKFKYRDMLEGVA